MKNYWMVRKTFDLRICAKWLRPLDIASIEPVEAIIFLNIRT